MVKKFFIMILIFVYATALFSVCTGDISVSTFSMTLSAGQFFIAQDLANGVNINFTQLSGTLLTNDGVLNCNSSGGSFSFTSSTVGTLQVTADSDDFALFVNDVYTSSNSSIFLSGDSMVFSWLYADSDIVVSVSPLVWVMDVGQTLSMSTDVSGGSGSYTSYRWYVDGVLQVGESLASFNYVPLVNGTHLISAVAIDSLGVVSTPSSPATITVFYAPTVRISPTSCTMDVGDSQTFIATAFNGTSVYTSYHWYVDGAIQTESSNVYSYYGGSAGSYLLTVRVTDSTGTISVSSSSVTIIVSASGGGGGTPTPTLPATPTPTPSIPTPPPVNYGPSKLYFRSDTYTTFEVMGYGLDSDYTNTAQSVTEIYTGSAVVNYAMKVYLFSSDTHYAELTDGPSAIISVNTNYTGLKSADCNIYDTSVVLGYQALKVELLEQFNGGEWLPIATFVSPVLITEMIESSTWQLNLYVNNTVTSTYTYATIVFGNSQYRSNIDGISFSEPDLSKVQMWRLSLGDFVGFLVGGYMAVLGDAFYVLLLFGICGSLYRRYQHFGVVAVFFVLFAGPGSILLLFLPAWAIIPTMLFLLLGCGFILWRIIR